MTDSKVATAGLCEKQKTEKMLKCGSEGFRLNKGHEVASQSDYQVSCPPLFCFPVVLCLTTAVTFSSKPYTYSSLSVF